METRRSSLTYGRRTGINILEGKNIRKHKDGHDYFEDYWTDESKNGDSVVSSLTGASGEEFHDQNVPNKPVIIYERPVLIYGRQTGSNILEGKNTCEDKDGHENFKDYWTDSENMESTVDSLRRSSRIKSKAVIVSESTNSIKSSIKDAGRMQQLFDQIIHKADEFGRRGSSSETSLLGANASPIKRKSDTKYKSKTIYSKAKSRTLKETTNITKASEGSEIKYTRSKIQESNSKTTSTPKENTQLVNKSLTVKQTVHVDKQNCKSDIPRSENTVNEIHQISEADNEIGLNSDDEYETISDTETTLNRTQNSLLLTSKHSGKKKYKSKSETASTSEKRIKFSHHETDKERTENGLKIQREIENSAVSNKDIRNTLKRNACPLSDSFLSKNSVSNALTKSIKQQKNTKIICKDNTTPKTRALIKKQNSKLNNKSANKINAIKRKDIAKKRKVKFGSVQVSLTEVHHNNQEIESKQFKNRSETSMKNRSAGDKGRNTFENNVDNVSQNRVLLDKEKMLPSNNKRKKYNHEIEENLLRRSSRQRFPVLERWRNERLLFCFEKGAPKLLGVDKGSVDRLYFTKPLPTKLKEKHKTKVPKKEIKNCIIYDTNNRKLNIIPCKKFSSVPWTHKKDPSDSVSYRIKKLFQTDSSCFGFVEVDKNNKKSTQYLPDEDLHMLILKGVVEVLMQENSFKAVQNDMFIIPKGIAYSIQNIGDTTARLSFAVGNFSFIESCEG